MVEEVEGDLGPDAVGGSGKKEVEWVDWLDEYRKMKEAKLKAEEVDKSPSKRRPFTADDKGKGKGESALGWYAPMLTRCW